MNFSTRWKLNSITAAVISAGAVLPTITIAADAALEEVVVVGSRGAPRTVAQSPVPVDVLSADELNKAGSSDMLEQLKGAIPSLNVHLQPISDAASMVRPINLRGLPSDNTLVMVNGKRRHRASVITFQGGGINDGSQGADISVIPSIALKQVEVLRDGASAQYGSDAIAGVINFVLNDASEGGSMSVKKGRYQAGDGDTTTVAGNLGLPLTDAGFMNLSFQMRQADPTSRSVQRADAQKLIDAKVAGVPQPYAQIWGSPEIKDDVTLFFNSGLDLGNGSEAYMFGNYSERDVESGFYYRNPAEQIGVYIDADKKLLVADSNNNETDDCSRYRESYSAQLITQLKADKNCFNFNETLPGGYTPRFIGNIVDTALTAGVRGDLTNRVLAGYHYDLSGSVGRNKADFSLKDTLNPSMGPDSPRDFATGSYTQLEKTFNADLQRQFGNTSVATGYEWREATFEVVAGDEASWKAGDYDSSNQPFAVGSHGFVGFHPNSAGAFTRRSQALYIDIESQLTDDLLVGGAVRYEDYSSFGDTTNYKVAFNYQLFDAIALRGSTSTGFRAPTMGQANVVNTQTSIDGKKLEQVQTLPSAKLGEGELKPEESESYALGMVLSAGEMKITIDYFNIDVNDRIALASDVTTTDSHRRAMKKAGIANYQRINKVSYFTNDFDTETQGVDIVATYPANFFGGTTDFSLANSWTDTEVTNAGKVTANNDGKVKTLQEGFPHQRATFTVAQNWEDISAFIRTNYFGGHYAINAFGEHSKQAASAVTVDAEATYRLNDNISVSAGGQNIFDQEAERLDNDSSKKFGAVYYETSPFSINGAYWYLKASYDF